MMRAWAAISAAAVLVALPTTVGSAAADVLESDTTPVAAAAAVDPLIDGHLGVLLWLSVALVAVVVAFVVLRRSRARLVADPDRSAGGPLAELRSVAATAGR